MERGGGKRGKGIGVKGNVEEENLAGREVGEEWELWSEGKG